MGRAAVGAAVRRADRALVVTAPVVVLAVPVVASAVAMVAAGAVAVMVAAVGAEAPEAPVVAAVTGKRASAVPVSGSSRS